MKRLNLILAVLGLLLFPHFAQAQSQRNPCYYTTTGVTSCQPVGTSVTGAGNGPLPVGGLANAAAPTFVEGKVGGLSFDLAGNLRVNASGGGVSSAVTIANGADVALGTTTDAVAATPTDATAATTISLLKALNNSNISSVPAGANIIGKVGIDQTTPGTTNLVAVTGSINTTLTDCSGTIAAGGTAQNAFTAAATRHGFTISNIDTSEVLWISFTGTAAASGTAAYPLAPATATTFANLASFTSPVGMGINTALSVVAATTTHKFSCTVW